MLVIFLSVVLTRRAALAVGADDVDLHDSDFRFGANCERSWTPAGGTWAQRNNQGWNPLACLLVLVDAKRDALSLLATLSTFLAGAPTNVRLALHLSDPSDSGGRSVRSRRGPSERGRGGGGNTASPLIGALFRSCSKQRPITSTAGTVATMSN